MTCRIHLASNNRKKLQELDRIVVAAGIEGIEILPLSEVPSYPEPIEDGESFADNALIKARAGAAATGLPTIADDSGLTVPALNGMPGIFSARWSGKHGDDAANNELLLAQLADLPDERRRAAFVSVCVLVIPDGENTVSEGKWEGRLLRAPRGENGFGYDPLFIPDGGDGRTAAEMSAVEKDACSHRGQALAGLVPYLRLLAL